MKKCKFSNFLLLKTALITLDPFRFHLNFRISFPICIKNLSGIFIKMVRGIYIHLKITGILPILNLLNLGLFVLLFDFFFLAMFCSFQGRNLGLLLLDLVLSTLFFLLDAIVSVSCYCSLFFNSLLLE